MNEIDHFKNFVLYSSDVTAYEPITCQENSFSVFLLYS
jgi:hypothetical protein